MSSYAAMLEAVVVDYPQIEVIATSLREVHSATVNDRGGICYADGSIHVAESRREPEILDRVGGGDSFATGIIYGLMDGRGIDESLDVGVAHGALAMTTPGDTSMATLGEVQRVANGGQRARPALTPPVDRPVRATWNVPLDRRPASCDSAGRNAERRTTS